MVYPSHYAKGEYGIPNPNDQPYKVIHLAMRGAIKALGPEGQKKLLGRTIKISSLPHHGIHYGKKEVRAQMQAGADLGHPQLDTLECTLFIHSFGYSNPDYSGH